MAAHSIERAVEGQQRAIDASRARETAGATAEPSPSSEPSSRPPSEKRPPRGREAEAASAVVNPPFAQLAPATRATDADLKTVTIPPHKPLVVFYLEYEAADPQQSYALALRDAKGQVIWQASNARARDSGAFLITLPTRLLEAGEYVFHLGAKQSGRPISLANYRFRVTRP
jgi:hypothetical protein